MHPMMGFHFKFSTLSLWNHPSLKSPITNIEPSTNPSLFFPPSNLWLRANVLGGQDIAGHCPLSVLWVAALPRSGSGSFKSGTFSLEWTILGDYVAFTMSQKASGASLAKPGIEGDIMAMAAWA